MTTTKKPETIRVIEVYNFLKKKGIVANAAKFCEMVDFAKPSFIHIKNLKGPRDAPKSLILSLNRVFGASLDYIIEGKEPMFPNGIPDLNKMVENLKSPSKKTPNKLSKNTDFLTEQSDNQRENINIEIETYKSRIEQQDLTIESLNEYIQVLKKELAATKLLIKTKK